MSTAFEQFERTPANFRALRDMVGFKQDSLADMLGVDRSDVRRWDSGKAPIPESAWRLLGALVDEHFEAVESFMAQARKASPSDVDVRLEYYRSMNDYPVEGGDWVSADNVARACAERLIELGYKVEFVYPSK